eukprot:1656143-Pyramimonas_sp.AAC.2
MPFHLHLSTPPHPFHLHPVPTQCAPHPPLRLQPIAGGGYCAAAHTLRGGVRPIAGGGYCAAAHTLRGGVGPIAGGGYCAAAHTLADLQRNLLAHRKCKL